MARTDPQFNVRMPVDLKEKIEVAAKKNGRSMNAEIVYRLQKSIEEEVAGAEPVDGVQEMDFRIVDPRLVGSHRIVNALEEMEKILSGTLRMLEEDEPTDGGETNKR